MTFDKIIVMIILQLNSGEYVTVGFLVIREFIERIEEDISAVAVSHIFFDAFFFLPKNPDSLFRVAIIALCLLYNGN